MKTTPIIVLCFAVLATAAFGADDFLDQVDDALTISAFQGNLRTRLSGTLDVEGYYLQQPSPGLLFTDHNHFFSPRLTLFLDAQLGPHIYVFAQSRVDRGFDPGEDNTHVRLDEYAVRFTPRDDARLNLQIGKFATVVGNWVPRHGSWDNPFVTAPLPYENLTGIWDIDTVDSAATLLTWAHIQPRVSAAEEQADKYKSLPVIWGPNYTSGAALEGTTGRIDYAAEVKNAALASRPESWSATSTNWRHPTVSGRLGYRPDEMWNLGFSASSGSYLRTIAKPALAAGHGLDDYREIVLGQDAGFAWHYWQIWAECYETRFAIPLLGHADTLAYYFEAKYKFTPQLFGALRWNQQLFFHDTRRRRRIRPLGAGYLARGRRRRLPFHAAHPVESPIQRPAREPHLPLVEPHGGRAIHREILTSLPSCHNQDFSAWLGSNSPKYGNSSVT